MSNNRSHDQRCTPMHDNWAALRWSLRQTLVWPFKAIVYGVIQQKGLPDLPRPFHELKNVIVEAGRWRRGECDEHQP